MRSKVELLVLFLVLNLGSVLSQNGRARGSRPLPQWLTGIIAVVGFLFLTFVVFLVKRAWCEKPKRNITDEEAKENEHMSHMEHRDSDELKSYTNFAMEQFEDKVTAM